jgi:hypothetical protein
MISQNDDDDEVYYTREFMAHRVTTVSSESSAFSYLLLYLKGLGYLQTPSKRKEYTRRLQRVTNDSILGRALSQMSSICCSIA